MKKILVLSVLAMIMTLLSTNQNYVEIPTSSIRMRVIAASNSEKDQHDKIKVKSFIEKKLYEMIDGVYKEEDASRIIQENVETMDFEIDKMMKEEGLDVSFESNFGYNYFPEKSFKGMTYKAGNYKSYVVTLGKGEGENWWCVLYPPLCLIDESRDDYEYHSLIKDTILKYN